MMILVLRLIKHFITNCSTWFIKKVGIPYEEARFGHDFRVIGLHTCILLFWGFDYIVILLYFWISNISASLAARESDFN